MSIYIFNIYKYKSSYHPVYIVVVVLLMLCIRNCCFKYIYFFLIYAGGNSGFK